MNHACLLALRTIDWLGVPHDGTSGVVSGADQQRQLESIVLFAISLLLLVWLIARIQSRMRMPQRPHQPYRVFNRLLKHHGLGRGDRFMLLVLAISRRMKQPTVLLLSPSLFTRYAEAWLSESRLGSFWPGARRKLVRVAQQVFAEDGVQKA